MADDVYEDRLPFEGVLAEVFRGVVSATRAEARASVTMADDAVDLFDGRRIGWSGSEGLWSFAVDRDVRPPEETPGSLVIDGGSGGPVPVRVLAVGDGSLVLASTADLGDRVEGATMSLNAGFVLEMLEQRLEHLLLDDAADATLVDALLNPDPDAEPEGLVPFVDPGPDGEQRAAASNAIVDGLRFTWGPPGTGKTRVLGMAVAEAVARGERVLVVAQANAAVDVAMARVAVELADSAELVAGRVLRAGPPQPGVLDRHEAVLPEFHLGERFPEEVARRDELVVERRRFSDRARRGSRAAVNGSATDEASEANGADGGAGAEALEEIRAELRRIDAVLDGKRREMLADATVIGTTLARLVIDETLWDWEPDVVVVEEASMVNVPFVLALAARGPRSLSLFGDFRQLPPIAVGRSAEVERWFGRDVFEVAGVIRAHEEGRFDGRVSMLQTQFRMGEQICGMINPFAYGGLLATDREARNRGIVLAERWPVPGVEVVVVDTSGLGGECVIEGAPDSFSRFSVASAALSVAIAESVAAEVAIDVAVVSPYRAQVLLAAAMTAGHPGVTAATIHRFQGSERDVVVFDLTDGPDQVETSRLTGRDADLSLRLLNVAASRARGKLVLLADLDWVAEAPPFGSNSRRLVEAAVDVGAEVVDARSLLAGTPPVPEESAWDPVVTWFDCWEDAIGALDDEVAAGASVDVHVASPDQAGPWLASLWSAGRADGGAPAGPDSFGGPASCEGSAAPATHRIVRAPVSVVRSLDEPVGSVEDSGGVSLRTVGAVPWVILNETSLVMGARDPDGPAVRIDGSRVVSAYRRLAGVAR